MNKILKMKNQNVFENKICFLVVVAKKKINELIIKIQNFANLEF